ncbi:MAG: hypothetical protein WBV23_10575 [Desulfobaccales bacterium]
MKKIISTLTAMTFALGLAAAAQAQVAKTPEKPAVQNTQAAPSTVVPKEAAKPGDPAAKDAVKPGNPDNTKSQGKKESAKKATQKVAKQGKAEKKTGAPMVTPQEGTK